MTVIIFTNNLKDLIGEIYTAEVHHVRPKVVILIDDDGMKLFYQRQTKFQMIFSEKEITFEGIIESVELK